MLSVRSTIVWRSLSILVPAILLFGAVWFMRQDEPASQLVQRFEDLFDPRPARHILIFGNSRTYYNDTPMMVRRMADSAGSTTKYQIEVEALGGASFESLWAEPRTQALLQSRWDDVILQSQSGAQTASDLDAS